MTHSHWLSGTAWAVVFAFGLVASGEEPNPRPVAVLNAASGAGSLLFGGGFAGLPGYPSLQTEPVQKELGLTPEQKDKLKEITRKAVEPSKNEPQTDWTKIRDLKPEEQRKIQQEMAARYAKRAEETKKLVEQILTPKQLDQLKDMEFRQRAASLLFVPQVLQQIELTGDQKQQLQKIREETQSKMMQLQRESQAKTLGVLTPEQTKKLKELSDKGTVGWGRPGQTLEHTERPKGK